MRNIGQMAGFQDTHTCRHTRRKIFRVAYRDKPAPPLHQTPGGAARQREPDKSPDEYFRPEREIAQQIRRLRRAIVENRDRDACYGAARVLFFFGGWENFTRASLDATLSTLIPVALRHPRPRNRQYVMWVLSQLPGGDEPLRWVLDGRSTPESIPQDSATEPEGLMYTRGLAPNEPLHASDRAYAAWLLGGLHATGVRDTIEDLAGEATGPDREILRNALEALGH